jgi:acetolactate synthase I/II/III large subunit
VSRAASERTTRVGGHVVAETFEALGAEIVFGLPGVHALPIWEGLGSSSLRVLPFRQEVNAGFAADGYARSTGRPATLLVSTGPGALMTLAPLQEAAASHVPVVVVSSQIESEAIGRGLGHLHELPDQAASFAPIVKWCGRAADVDSIPELLADAWRCALTPPQGPVYVELPVDLLHATTETPRRKLSADPPPRTAPPGEVLDEAARLLSSARRPLVWAGAGVLRSEAWSELTALAERLDAPVATTYGGRGALPDDHPLALGSGWDERAHLDELTGADVILCVGSSLGYELTDTYRLELSGTLIQIDAAAERIGLSYPALALVGDAKATLAALLERVSERSPGESRKRIGAVRERVGLGLDGQGRELELGLLRSIAAALPSGAVSAWDSTILAYVAAAHLPVAGPRTFLYPVGSSTLGYAWPAALGAAAAGTKTLAVAGDGGFMYGLSELATARQYDLDATLLVVDDGGYGILREYQRDAGFGRFAVDLEQPDFLALAESFGVPGRRTAPERLEEDLRGALAEEGPAVVVLPVVLSMPRPTP